MNNSRIQKVRVIDSHTGGEPTRVVIDGGPDLGTGTLRERRDRFRAYHDRFRSAVTNEPRGSDVLVGAILLNPSDSVSAAATIFFNNVGCLGMCGHGTIGLIATLAYLGRIAPGEHRIETPVGIVTARLHPDGEVSVRNVPSYRFAAGVPVLVPGVGEVVGDIAWGGNWFYLVGGHEQDLSLDRTDELTAIASNIRRALATNGITGANGEEIDHIELFAQAEGGTADSRNFVLCPGNAYDRSPCGTGTSAKLACLYTDGKLAERQIWRQESITGSVFEGSVERVGADIIPTITGTAWITSDSTLILDADDPLCWGIPGRSVQ